jgi:acyl-CoA synthetase (AMP-forming)/AMP-acid ligase II
VNLCELLVERARSHADAMAIVERGRAVTFAELEDLTARGAGLLRTSGLHPGDRVLLLQPVSIELYVILLAVLRLGLVVTLIDPAAGRLQIAAAMQRARPAAFIGSMRAQLFRLMHGSLRAIRPAFTTGIRCPGLRGWRPDQTEPYAPIESRAADDPALITFTSGSTGVPKATARSHGFLLAQHAALERAIDMQPGEVDLATLPVFVLANLASAVTTVLPDADLRHPGAIAPEPVLEQIASLEPGRSTASPAFFECLIAAPRPERIATIRKLYTGGAPVFPRLLERLQSLIPGGQVVTLYGSTEAEPISHVAWSEVTVEDRQRMRSGKGLLVGTPVDEIELRVVDMPRAREGEVPRYSSREFEQRCRSIEEDGEIVVTGEHVVRGYLDGAGDAETKIEVEGIRWHRTGDAGFLDDRGRLWLLGRVDSVIRDQRGSVYPFSVECVASEYAEVRRSALYALDGKRCLAVELSGGSDVGQVIDSLYRELDWAHLGKIHPVKKIPVDKRHNAKVDYVALAKVVGDD